MRSCLAIKYHLQINVIKLDLDWGNLYGIFSTIYLLFNYFYKLIAGISSTEQKNFNRQYAA